VKRLSSREWREEKAGRKKVEECSGGESDRRGAPNTTPCPLSATSLSGA